MIENNIIAHLIHNEEYLKRVLPFLKTEYFKDRPTNTLHSIIDEYVQNYNHSPSLEAISTELSYQKNLSEEEFAETKKVLQEIDTNKDNYNLTDIQYLLDTTEKFCKDRAINNAILDGIKILDNKDKQRTAESIPDLLKDALGVNFNTAIGHDYLEMTEERYQYYHRVEERIPFDLQYFNKITKGGLPKKTLNVILAGTGVGKSMFMCHMASNMISQGKNVLYITMEMAEERIAERIDANLLDITIDDLYKLPKTYFDNKIQKLKSKINGRLVIKEYPTASAHAGHMKILCDELMLKKNFKADAVFVDYLNICTSRRFKGGNVNSYFYVKAIAEELRGLAVELNVPIISATQTTRQGFTSTDIGLEDTSESFGLPATADFMFAVIANEDLDKLNQIAIKQLKNRYSDPSINRKFVIGVDRSKMRFYDLEETAQQGMVDTGQVKKEDKRDPYDKFGDITV